ncbi:MAG: tryptophan synthase subunit alpha, partial [Planctomycetes bacterium]|nr:tryptophan synthase subunit alpha [Planctomycetota bacterium]
ESAGLDTVFLIAPTSTPERLAKVGRESRGFVYAVSLTGVTGERNSLPPELGDFIKRAREHISLPICVGFGISTPEMAEGVAKVADGVIVGSAIVKIIAAPGENGDPVPGVAAFVESMASVL